MTKFCTNRNKQTILIESIPYSNWEIEMVRMNIPADNRSFRQELFSFLSEWFDPADTLLVHTSGSTGKPASPVPSSDCKKKIPPCFVCPCNTLPEKWW